MFPVIQIFESRLIRNCALLVAGCLFNAGLAMGMPTPPHGETAGSSGTISFSGAIVAGTCAAPTADAADGSLDGLPARGECHSGESYAGYRFNAREIGDRPAVRLLRYAKDTYGKAVVLTYVYD